MQNQPPTSSDVEDNKAIAALSYVFVLCFVPLVAAKRSPYAQFHAKQGLALFLIELIMMILFNPLVLLFFPFLGFLYFPLLIAVIVLSLMGIVKALRGVSWKMPVIHNIVKALKL